MTNHPHSQSILVSPFSESLVKEILNSRSTVILFDTKLNYAVVNETACEQLNKDASELIGKNILDVFPDAIASGIHRSLLRALHGETIRENIISILSNKRFHVLYEPVYVNGKIAGVLTKTDPLK